jgi:hypothetical protein
MLEPLLHCEKISTDCFNTRTSQNRHDAKTESHPISFTIGLIYTENQEDIALDNDYLIRMVLSNGTDYELSPLQQL